LASRLICCARRYLLGQQVDLLAGCASSACRVTCSPGRPSSLLGPASRMLESASRLLEPASRLLEPAS
jgi:hypothetical protein